MPISAAVLTGFEGALAPANPAGPSPVRRTRSVRRTSSIDTTWPEGLGPPMRMHGRARDIYTSAQDGPIRLLAEDDVYILSSTAREILEIRGGRRNTELQALVGQRGGGYLRGVLASLLPDELTAGSPLNLLLDDFSGASLVAPWAWSRWTPDWQARMRSHARQGGEFRRPMEGICSGFQPGASSLAEDGAVSAADQNSARVVTLPRPDDPAGWHALDVQDGVGMRRARRIDVWLQDDLACVDVGFQDSATNPEGGPDRIAVHEYQVQATADLETLTLRSVVADPRVLPYRECPGASPNAGRMVGCKLSDLRLEVPRALSGIVGCTHLNDVLRSLADVPQLISGLRAELARDAA